MEGKNAVWEQPTRSGWLSAFRDFEKIFRIGIDHTPPLRNTAPVESNDTN